MQRIPFILEQLDSTRAYTLAVLDHTPRELWGRVPDGAPTHILWHVGHLAFAQYAQFFLMIMGETPADLAAFPKERYFTLFAKGTSPQAATPEFCPSPDELLVDLARLQQHVKDRLPSFPENDFALPTLRPHQVARTRWDMAMWWIKHESLHTGQIALLRRLLGCPPWR